MRFSPVREKTIFFIMIIFNMDLDLLVVAFYVRTALNFLCKFEIRCKPNAAASSVGGSSASSE